MPDHGASAMAAAVAPMTAFSPMNCLRERCRWFMDGGTYSSARPECNVMSEIASERQAYAQQIVAASGANTPALLDAFAAIPREQFLGPGPWVIVGVGDPKPRRTPDADPRHLYADASVAIDAERQLFNGAPSFLARMIDSLALAPGSHVVHIGAGTGYYSAIIGYIVGATRRLVAAEIDEPLAVGGGAQ